MAQQMQNINQAAEQLTDATQQAFRILADRTVALQESNLRFTENFYKNWIEQVNNQAQGTRQVVQNLRDQGQRQREAVESLSREATNTYSEFLNSALGFYQNAVGTAMQVAQQNMQAGVQAASQTAQQATDVANQAG
jgi:vacuolar-type H+-ATPase subunit H